MSAAYWNQFDRSEILSMHGIESEDYEEETEPKQTLSICECSNCMSCLGLSWNDFL